MKFPGKRKSKHYFPVSEKTRTALHGEFASKKASFYAIGIDQLLVDIEVHVEDSYLKKYGIKKGESQVLDDKVAETIYWELKEKNAILGEFAGGAVGNTLHNFSVLSDERSVILGAIAQKITVGDYAFKYLCHTSAKVDLSYLQPCPGTMAKAICFVTPDKERTFGIAKGCMNDLTPEFIPPKVIQGAAVLSISAFLLRDENAPLYHSTLKACQVARDAQIPVVMTLGTSTLIQEKKEFFSDFIAQYVDVIAMNELECEALTGLADPLLAAEKALDICDMVLITVGAQGLYLAAYVDEESARLTKDELHTKSLIDYNKYEYSRAMRRKDCTQPVKIYSHINPFLGGPLVIMNTNGAGDGALSAMMHDMAANLYHQNLVPNSPKHNRPYLTYSSLAQISKYANRVSFEVLMQNSPRLLKGLPEREESLYEDYWEL